MIAGIVGDVIGSVYEAHQWVTKDQPLIQPLPLNTPLIKPLFEKAKWVRNDYSWTDDTLCTLALYSAYINQTSPIDSLLHFCNKYKEQSIGFGKSFEAWLDNPVPYESYANGCIMRIGFIPWLKISLQEKLKIGREYTTISHNHPDSFEAVEKFIILSAQLESERLIGNVSKVSIKELLNHYNYTETVDSLHNAFKFEMNALQTFLQACVIVLESNSIEEVLVNSFYVGGDSDTLACIAGNLAGMIYSVPKNLVDLAHLTLKDHNDLYYLVKHFSTCLHDDFS